MTKIKNISVYRDCGSTVITMEDGTGFFIPNRKEQDRRMMVCNPENPFKDPKWIAETGTEEIIAELATLASSFLEIKRLYFTK
jgi:hypothetical protein